MDLRTKLLAAAAAVLGAAALVLIVNWALKQPDERDKKNLVRVDIGDLSNGHFRIVDTDALRFFIIHTEDRFQVIAAPMTDGAVPMPGPHWWRPAMYCREFGLDAENGSITAAARFRCRDSEHAEHLKRWQWNLSGAHIPNADNPTFDDLYRVKIERSGDEIVLLGLETD